MQEIELNVDAMQSLDQRCLQVADAIFYHFTDRESRKRVHEALLMLLGPIEERLEALETDSHPPVDLLPVIEKTVAETIKAPPHRKVIE
ncbi:MAG: hypothetical protein AAGK02_15085 [Pseudomonadota bacterium]